MPSMLERDLAEVLNRHSQENPSNTPDFILAHFLQHCLTAWNEATQERTRWYEDTKGVPPLAE